MPKLVHPLHVGCDFARLGRFCRNRSKLFVEIEVCSCSSGDEPCAATEGEILDCPLDKNQNAALELDYIHQMDERPYEPGRQSGQMHAKGISHRRPPANNRQIALVEILEVCLLRFSLDAPQYRIRCIRSLLHRNLGNALQWRPIPIQSESEISDNVEIWIIGNGELGTYFYSSASVGFRFRAARQRFPQCRYGHATSPNNSAGFQTIDAGVGLDG